MKSKIFDMTILLFFLFCSFGFAHDIDPDQNNWALDYKSENATVTENISNWWKYTASGTINTNFSLGESDEFFETKILSNRLIEIIKNEKGELAKGYNFKGLETILWRVHAPENASPTIDIDGDGRAGKCTAIHYIYQTLGSSTFLHLKKGKNHIKGWK